MENRALNIIERYGQKYIVIRTRITTRGFMEYLVRQIVQNETAPLTYLVDYR